MFSNAVENPVKYSYSVVQKLSISINEEDILEKTGVPADFSLSGCAWDSICKSIEKKLNELGFEVTEYDILSLVFSFEFPFKPSDFEIQKIAITIHKEASSWIKEKCHTLSAENEEN